MLQTHFKYLSFCLFFFLLFGDLKQSNAQGFEFGISRGVAISSHESKFIYRDANVLLSPSATANRYLSVVIRKNISESLHLLTEPSIIHLGAKYNETFSYQGNEIKTKSESKLKYLQIPLLLQFFTGASTNTSNQPFLKPSFHLTGGIFGEYLLDARFEGTNTPLAPDNPSKTEISEDVILQYSRYDGGIIVGGGVEFGREAKIGFETRAQYTFIQTYNGTPKYKPKNFALVLSLYVMI